MARKGIDISTYNGNVNIAECKKEGCDFAILKIIRKDLARDNQFDSNYKKCEKAGMEWGVYNYSYATSVNKAKSDMNLVCDILDKISKKYFKFGVWFDIEDKCQEKLSKSQIADILNAAQKVVEDRGYAFGIYTGKSFYEEHIDASKVNCNNWWIARYYRGYDKLNISFNPNQSYKPEKPSGMIAWQYTSSGRFNKNVSSGNGGNFDLNYLYKDMPALKKQTVSTSSATTTAYFKKYTGKSSRIDVVFEAIGVPSAYRGSPTKRNKIAVKNGISNYKGSELQNLTLIAKAKQGKLKKN